jgi:hypothetical protein
MPHFSRMRYQHPPFTQLGSFASTLARRLSEWNWVSFFPALISINACETEPYSNSKMEGRMPLLRYFLWGGGALLGLLFVLDACLPKPPVAHGASYDLPFIRIHSDRKWPERVVYDTDLHTVTAVPIASIEILMAPANTADALAKVQVREAYAKLQPSSVNKRQPSGPRGPATTQPKRKVAKRPAPPVVRLAQRPQFGFLFGRGIW